MHKLFGRFEQLRSTDGKQRPGSGLGLAIAKAIVEQHGGQIGVEQPEEGGSTFWFSLPLALDEDDDDNELDREDAVNVSQSNDFEQSLASTAAIAPLQNYPKAAAAVTGVARAKSKKAKRGKRNN